MNLEQTKDAFIIWVYSCITEEQLRLLESIADEFVAKRFNGLATTPYLIHASAEIGVAIYRQKENIVIEAKNKILTTTHNYDQD